VCGGIQIEAAAGSTPVSLPTAWALADQPTLTGSDAGYLAYVTDYGHLVRWTGSVWEFAPGDVGNKFLRMFFGAPQEVGWQLCDGSATTYLVVGGATLTTAAFTTPNISVSTAFIKTIAAYTGTINSAIAPGISGSVANESSHTHAAGSVSGSTANESSHTHQLSSGNFTMSQPTATTTVDQNLDGATNTVAGSTHLHTIGTMSSDAGSAHAHGAGSLAVGTSGAGSAHSHTVGTLAVDSEARPPAIGFLPYIRR
jgi:hypothetical protein